MPGPHYAEEKENGQNRKNVPEKEAPTEALYPGENGKGKKIGQDHKGKKGKKHSPPSPLFATM
jgi:hypothetical protein